MGPIDYSIDVKSPFESALQGYAGGAAIRDDQAKQLQQQTLQQQQQQQRQVLQSLIAKPDASADDYSNAMLLVPGMKDQLKQSWDTKSAAQQQSKLSDLSQWGAAIQNGKPEIAIDAMKARADAMEKTAGSPTQESKIVRMQADMIAAHPEFGRFMIKSMLAAHPDGGKVVTALAGLGGEERAAEQAPADLLKKRSDAAKAAAEAGVAPEKAVLDTQKVAEEIKTAQNQRRISELDVQIKQANSETDRGRLQLERDKLVAEQNLKQQAAASDNQTHLDTLSQSLATVGELMKHPGLNSGTGVGSTVASFFNGTDAKDFRLQVETLKSQQFLTAAKELKGMGALSDAEGARLEKSIASLDPNMSTKQFKNNLGVIQNTLQKAQSKLVASGKLPTTGGAFVMTHPVYGTVKDGDVNRLLTQFPGATRQQVIDYLKSTGGK